jgi:hypothetical protein
MILKFEMEMLQKMGFEIEPGDGIVDDVSVTLDYFGKGNPKVLFRKILT